MQVMGQRIFSLIIAFKIEIINVVRIYCHGVGDIDVEQQMFITNKLCHRHGWLFLNDLELSPTKSC